MVPTMSPATLPDGYESCLQETMHHFLHALLLHSLHGALHGHHFLTRALTMRPTRDWRPPFQRLLSDSRYIQEQLGSLGLLDSMWRS